MEQIVAYAIDWQCVHDAGEVSNNFQELKNLHIYGEGSKMVVEGVKFPFLMRAIFEGNGVARIEVFYKSARMEIEIYDSKIAVNNGISPSELFYNLSKSAYEAAATKFIEDRFCGDVYSPISTPEEIEWAIRFQLYLIRETSRKISNDANVENFNNKKLLNYHFGKLEERIKILNNIPR